jgi:pimeloyl-ACP methyl ester carboxylesterase
MIRRLLLSLGALAVVLVLLAGATIAMVVWRAHVAAREGAAQLAAVRNLQAPIVTPASGAPVLILLHGAGLNAHMWDPVRRHLDPALRVIALDLPGHGIHRDEDYSLDGAAAAVLMAARSVAPARVVLIGDSLGGFTAMWAAPLLPRGQLAGLVLGGSTDNGSRMGEIRLLSQWLLVRALGVLIPQRKLAARALGRFHMSRVDAGAILAGGVSFGAIGPAALSLAGVDFRSRLSRVTAPLLIINGVRDRSAMAEEASFAAAVPHATILNFDCPHGVSMYRPAGFAAAVNAFVHRIASASDSGGNST